MRNIDVINEIEREFKKFKNTCLKRQHKISYKNNKKELSEDSDSEEII